MKIYHWVDTLSCGHIQTAEMAVDYDRSDRVGTPAVCFKCEPKNVDVQVVAVRFDRVEEWHP
jgi:hypothetical protein